MCYTLPRSVPGRPVLATFALVRRAGAYYISQRPCRWVMAGPALVRIGSQFRPEDPVCQVLGANFLPVPGRCCHQSLHPCKIVFLVANLFPIGITTCDSSLDPVSCCMMMADVPANCLQASTAQQGAECKRLLPLFFSCTASCTSLNVCYVNTEVELEGISR